MKDFAAFRQHFYPFLRVRIISPQGDYVAWCPASCQAGDHAIYADACKTNRDQDDGTRTAEILPLDTETENN